MPNFEVYHFHFKLHTVHFELSKFDLKWVFSWTIFLNRTLFGFNPTPFNQK